MILRLSTFGLFTFFVLILQAEPTPSPATTVNQPTALIPIRQFFDNPKISSASLSPDGKRLAYLAPAKNRLNIWVCEVGQDFNSARLITHDEKRGISHFFWTRDSRYIIYGQDQAGNENFHLYRVDPTQPEGSTTDLTPFPEVRADVIDLPKPDKDTILVAMNKRDKRFFDAYKLQISTGTLTLLEQNPGDVDSWCADFQGVIRACVAQVGHGDTELRVRDSGSGPFRVLARYTDEEEGSIEGFGKDGSFVYVSNARNTDTIHFSKMDLKTGAETIIAQDPQYDFSEAILSDFTDDLLAVVFDKERVVYQPFDAAFAHDLKILSKLHDGDIMFRSSNADETKFIIAYNSPTDPGATYLYDRASGKAQFLYRPRPWLKPSELVGMTPVSFPSRDGLELHGYLTLPKETVPYKKRDALHLPFVLVVHGGPWARDSWGYDPEVQFLANRGFAVLQMNYRGSTGYGKKFVHAGDKEWGGKMLDDLVDAVHWAEKHGYADPKHVGIYGGSYGGYATLAALAFEPDVFACGVDYVGVSNLLTFMNTIPPYWETGREMMYKRVGNPKVDTELLRKRSPLFAADKIKAPLFIAQGYQDPRVNHAEAEQMVEAMKKNGHPVEYMVKMDEGHGFANPENRIDFYQSMEKFLEKYLMPN